MERRLHSFERREIAAQLGQVACAALEAARHDVGDEVLLKPHVRIGIIPGDFGLDHPEFRQVAARLRLLGAERRTEAIDLAERGGSGFDVELPGLREIGLAEVEVIDGKQRSRMLTDRSGENRRVHEREMAILTGSIGEQDRKSTRLNSSHPSISYAVFCLKKKNPKSMTHTRHPPASPSPLPRADPQARSAACLRAYYPAPPLRTRPNSPPALPPAASYRTL